VTPLRTGIGEAGIIARVRAKAKPRRISTGQQEKS
jgi:hypothetical protein